MPHQHLTLSLPDNASHQLNCQLQLTLATAQTLVLMLPRWIPGSYLLRDFAKHLTITLVTDEQGNSLSVERLDLARWQLHAPAGKVTINYALYAFDASVRACYITNGYAFINPAASALVVEAWRDNPYQVTIQAPEHNHHWSVHTTLAAGQVDQQGYGHYLATHYDDLIEHPILIGEPIIIDFEVCNIPHQMVLVDEAPLAHVDCAKIATDLIAICTTEQHFWHSQTPTPPFNRYLFQVMVSQEGYGGLEHMNSTALMTARASLPRINQSSRKAYEDFLGLCSHEYFHAWLVKRIKPNVFIRPALHVAVLTPLLWIFEGFTSLYDDWMLLRSQRIGVSTLLSRWSDSLTRTLTTQGGTQQSLADASQEAWIKFYQPNENSANSQVSYYTRGMATALLLLAELQHYGHHLDSLLQHWWHDWQQDTTNGLTTEKLIHDLHDLCPDINWSIWLEQHVDSPNPHLAEQLALKLPSLGLGLVAKVQPSLGFKLVEEQGMLMVKHVQTHAPAHLSGLQVGDEILALQNWRVRTHAQVETHLAHWQALDQMATLTLTYIRQGYLQQTHILPQLLASSYELESIDTTAQQAWLIRP